MHILPLRYANALGIRPFSRLQLSFMSACFLGEKLPKIWLLVVNSGTGGGGLELVEISGPIVKVRITGPAASVMTVRVAVTQKLREKFPAIAAVQLVN